ncbi:MAG: zinc metallopeptidase [Clostridium sp.]|nr:zinc metallopeptidase [Acetatifactor muris]MCM1527264.1 zinc metallopeptidase [Bacteroides sp.]MCM1563042.1 zinc metallopeptidase [Clostridium sp.]
MLYGYGYYYDPTYLLVVLGMFLCLGASALVNSTMSRYQKVRNSTGLSGAEAAQRILRNEGLYDVRIECLPGTEGDHYDPRSNTVRLSEPVYYSPSVASVAVAAHECGHAIQHAKGYAPLTVRSVLAPVAGVAGNLGMPLILVGVLLSWNQTLIQIGIWAFMLAVAFQLVMLPVEFNASRRAVAKVSQYGLLSERENEGCKKVLTAAALTYVAGAASAILQLLRLFLLFGGGRNRDD